MIFDTPAIGPARLAGAREPRPAFYFYRLDPDGFISTFCVANADDTPTDEFPDGNVVFSVRPDGSRARWAKRAEGDLLVFYPPDRALAMDGAVWAYDRRVQVGQAAPRDVLERYALGSRVSTAL